jgi:hypothetical protein
LTCGMDPTTSPAFRQRLYMRMKAKFVNSAGSMGGEARIPWCVREA